ncbi:porin family protein [Botryobacter ruber]|uniref:porin family protein n=1 Tax=Botryobacter ruber TaxID=2171629 RepID=UPI000E0A22F7|nr:porin family protein [Botryobacter ruber]
MKKAILSVLAVLAVAVAAQAQSFTVGVKGGMSSAKLDIKEARSNPMMYRDPENINGYHAGLFTRLQFMGIMLQPEALLVSSGGKFTYDSGGSTLEEKFRLTRLDVPIMLGYNFLEVVRVNAGPVASMVLNARQEGDDVKDALNKSDWGLQAGIGLDIARFTLDARYERIIRDYDHTSGSANTSLKLNNQQVIFSLGYKLIE